MRKLKKAMRAAEKAIRNYDIAADFDRKKVRNILSSPVTLLATFSVGFIGSFLLLGKRKAKKVTGYTTKTPAVAKEANEPKQSSVTTWLPYVIELATVGIGLLKAKSISKHH